MANIRLQDVTAIINGTSLYNGGLYDTCHVEMLLVSDEPIPPESSWYVPKQDNPTIPPIVAEIFKMTNIKYYPQSEATLTTGLNDTLDQAKNNDLAGVLEDVPRLLLLSILKKANLNPIPNSTNCYMLQYDYKLYPLPDIPNTFEFYVQLPFDTLIVGGGGRVQCTILTPINSLIDTENTKGIPENNAGVIEEHNTNAEYSRRPVVSFQFQNDPLFVVRYHY